MTAITLSYVPQERQHLLHATTCRQILYGGAAGGGKIVRDHGVVLTPFGWKWGYDLQIGDRVNAPDGTTSRIVQVHPRVKLPGVRVSFHDGTATTVAWDHLWLAWRSGKRRKRPGNNSVFGEEGAEVIETRELAEWLKIAQASESKDKRPNWPLIPVCKPQVFNVQNRYDIDLDPYQLGYWLGDGHVSGPQIGFTTGDLEHFAEQFGLKDATLVCGKTYILKGKRREHWKAMLSRAGLSGCKSDTKFVPREFLWGSIADRSSVLQGLLDTDGTVDERGQVYFCSTSPKLIDDVMHLVQSLGGTASRFGKEPFYRDENGEKVNGKPAETLYIKLPDEKSAFRLRRKKDRCQEGGNLYRRVVAVEETEEIEGRCITVSHPSGLYVTNDFIVTHNSHSIRWDGIMFCLQNPGCQAYLFRRTLNELYKNHIVKIKSELPPDLGLGRYSENRNAYEFTNGSVLYCCYCEKESDVLTYQGAEMHWCGIDEAAHLTESQIGYLKTRNRLGGWKPTPGDAKRLPRFVMGSNPGGVGHTYLKSLFIDKAPPETVFYDDVMRDPDNPDDKGWRSIFIPAKIADNRFIDADYRASFGAIAPEMAKALREGDWDAVVGQALHNLSKERHRIRQFVPPRHWTRFMAMDWGTARPFSVGWYCVSDGAVLKAREKWPEVWLPPGALVRYAEWYGWNGRPNRGCRLDSRAVARRIVRMEKQRDETMDYRVGDYSMWAQDDGPSVVDNMAEEEPTFVMRKSVKDRKSNYTEILSRLAGNEFYTEDGVEETHPMLFVTENCTHFWRTVPSLTSDENDPEKGPGLAQENHVYDELAYGCRSRPFVTTEQERFLEVYGEEVRAARKQNVDPYYSA